MINDFFFFLWVDMINDYYYYILLLKTLPNEPLQIKVTKYFSIFVIEILLLHELLHFSPLKF